jgi:hypothetical protein
LTTYHHNTRGLRSRTSEILLHIHYDLPNLLCFLEHHLNHSDEDLTCIDNDTLGAEYCRQKIQKGGVSIFVQSNLQFSTINLDSYCIDKDNEV